MDCPVGYYTAIYGTGEQPSDVHFTSPKGVYSQEGDFSIGGGLSSFWRSAENFRTSANNKWYVGSGMMWAVSQAAPLRRAIIDEDLLLFEYEPPIPGAGEESGGYASNVKVGGKISLGSQQQFFVRDSVVGEWAGGVWNVVVTGVKGAAPSHCGNAVATAGNTHNATAPAVPPRTVLPGPAGESRRRREAQRSQRTTAPAPVPMTNVPVTPVVAEKPYITIDGAGKFTLQIPGVKTNSSGYAYGNADTVSIGFEQVKQKKALLCQWSSCPALDSAASFMVRVVA